MHIETGIAVHRATVLCDGVRGNYYNFLIFSVRLFICFLTRFLVHSTVQLFGIFQQYYLVREKRERLYLWLFIDSFGLYCSLCSNLFRLFVIKCAIKLKVIINVL